ncbi:hypothetical protein QUB80_11565 [Chlorogloeopsis sp. ULAP01]|nr:hypothetical protein [Chlorogloeopsis sp. ULAP01]MDM9381340.1 hypothetical protein [Chlorogloeopsis sp. ULAP01]
MRQLEYQPHSRSPIAVLCVVKLKERAAIAIFPIAIVQYSYALLVNVQ